MNKQPWLSNYPTGVPKSINADKYKSLPDLFAEAREKFADRPAYENMDKIVSFEEFDNLSTNFGAFLQKDLGLKQGDNIAIQIPNIIQSPVAIHGALKAGLTVVNTNPLYTPSEMRHQFSDSEVKAVVILANFARNLEEIIAETSIQHVIVTELGDLLGGFKGSSGW